MDNPFSNRDWSDGFWAGIPCGLLGMKVFVLLALSISGCKMGTPQVNRGCHPVEAIITTWDTERGEHSVLAGEDVAFTVRSRGADCAVEVSAYEDGVVRVKIGEPKSAAMWDTVYQWPTKEMLRKASDMAAAHADSAANSQRTVSVNQSDSSAKVAAVMAANDITLPQVVAFLYAYGFDVVSRSNTLRPHWTAAPPGRDAQGNIVPVAYYVANLRIATSEARP